MSSASVCLEHRLGCNSIAGACVPPLAPTRDGHNLAAANLIANKSSPLLLLYNVRLLWLFAQFSLNQMSAVANQLSGCRNFNHRHARRRSRRRLHIIIGQLLAPVSVVFWPFSIATLGARSRLAGLHRLRWKLCDDLILLLLRFSGLIALVIIVSHLILMMLSANWSLQLAAARAHE